MNQTKPKYAVFDFDGTIVAKDTLISLLKLCFKSQPWRLLFLVPFSPIVFVTYLFKLDRSVAKSVVLWCATCFRSKKNIISLLNKDIISECENLWFKDAIQTLNQLRNEGHEIIIATASGQLWIRALLRTKFPHSKMIIGTRLKFFCTGVILASKNCRNQEKLNRIRKQLGHDFEWESSWSDHTADIPILKAAKKPFIISPKPEHLVQFQETFGAKMTVYNWETK